jgi:hypothetical protein
MNFCVLPGGITQFSPRAKVRFAEVSEGPELAHRRPKFELTFYPAVR